MLLPNTLLCHNLLADMLKWRKYFCSFIFIAFMTRISTLNCNRKLQKLYEITSSLFNYVVETFWMVLMKTWKVLILFKKTLTIFFGGYLKWHVFLKNILTLYKEIPNTMELHDIKSQECLGNQMHVQKFDSLVLLWDLL